MSRRRLENKNIRKLSRSGKTSIYVTLPIEIIRKLNWREKQKVVVTQKGNGIWIEDWKE
ncbi:MAG: AbrB/MazE/SpoVT family DNA-binding domain-containing protein [Candidatus Levybacteria bacterium]|nr:AbrB/MazE/SpoVT family DNA-binding domain-containing protein [Candidatus Levybacteria bacterium]